LAMPRGPAGDSVWAVAMRGGWAEDMEARDIQERWVDSRDEYEFERNKMEEERKAAEERLREEEEMGGGMY